MPKVAKELSALEVKNLTRPGHHFVGGVAGLLLQVTDNGGRSWILRTTVGGKRRDIGLGGFPTVTLALARENARLSRDKIRNGIDPVAERLEARNTLAMARASSITFEEAAKKYISSNAAGWRNAKHAAQWPATLKKYVYPIIGAVQVSVIETVHVVNILEPLWTSKTETASRLRGRIEAVLDWATARGYRKGENPARWKGHLSSILPAAGRVKRTVHHSALDYRQVSDFFRSLNKIEGLGAQALRFLILTAARSGEVRGAKWSEIDREAKLWTVPAARMKGKREHRVPLSDMALDLLSTIPRVDGSDYIFPSSKGSALSDMTLTVIIRRMHKEARDRGGTGWVDQAKKQITVHGFRSTFRDWAGEMTGHSREVIEHALAHKIPDKAEASYARGTLFDKRRRLMNDWSQFCSTTSDIGAAVIPMRGA